MSIYACMYLYVYVYVCVCVCVCVYMIWNYGASDFIYLEYLYCDWWKWIMWMDHSH